jgi:hypothetical protein
MCYSHETYYSLHTGLVRSALHLQPPLFLVARQSFACEYNIYFYLFYLPLYLKSLSSTQGVGGRDFLWDEMLCKAVHLSLHLGVGPSHTRSRS